MYLRKKKLILFDKKTTHYALSAVPDTTHILDPLTPSVAFLSVAPMAFRNSPTDGFRWWSEITTSMVAMRRRLSQRVWCALLNIDGGKRKAEIIPGEKKSPHRR